MAGLFGLDARVELEGLDRNEVFRIVCDGPLSGARGGAKREEDEGLF